MYTLHNGKVKFGGLTSIICFTFSASERPKPDIAALSRDKVRVTFETLVSAYFCSVMSRSCPYCFPSYREPVITSSRHQWMSVSVDKKDHYIPLTFVPTGNIHFLCPLPM